MIRYSSREEWYKHWPRNAIVAEVGVAQGNNAINLLSLAQPQCLYLIDSWCQRTDGHPEDIGCTNKKEWFDWCHQYVNQLFGSNPAVKIIKADSLVAAKMFADEFFDIVYIDANHLELPVYNDVCAYWPLVKRGGMLTGHDYFDNGSYVKAKLAIDRFCVEYNLELDVLTQDEPAISWGIIKQ